MQIFIFFTLMLFSSLLFAKPIVIVSILPEKTFVQKIAKDLVEVAVMVEPGSSPHAYEPKSTQMISLSKADIYFSIGVEFEGVWLEKFKSQNPNLRFVNLSENVQKIQMKEKHHEDAKHEVQKDAHQHEGVDPHTWIAPKNVSIMAHSIYKTLAEIDPQNEKTYKTNLDNFIKEIQDTDAQIKNVLKDIGSNTTFMVFHPSWGYFANEYNLTQISVEVNGKNPKPKEMITIIKEAKEEKVKVIFTQPEFSDKSAQVIAKELNIPVKKLSPMDAEWSQNLINMAKSIANK
ncbi:MAG: zinc ABC transporter substrate-binding protein [Campylobacterales bacterium]|nr:zinc ABC transporter substrate-binding protein [Campylobacterales bacterium]